jgi:hypothetical protein
MIYFLFKLTCEDIVTAVMEKVGLFGSGILTGALAYRQGVGVLAVAGVSLITMLANDKLHKQELKFLRYMNLGTNRDSRFKTAITTSAMAPLATLSAVKLVMRVLGRPFVIPTGVIVLGVMGLTAFAVLVVKLQNQLHHRTIRSSLPPVVQIQDPPETVIEKALISSDAIETTTPHALLSGPDGNNEYLIKDSLKERKELVSRLTGFESYQLLPQVTILMPRTQIEKWEDYEKREKLHHLKVGVIKPSGDVGLRGLYDCLQSLCPVDMKQAHKEEVCKGIMELVLPGFKLFTFFRDRVAKVPCETNLTEGCVYFDVKQKKGLHIITITRELGFRIGTESNTEVKFNVRHEVVLQPGMGFDAAGLKTYFYLKPKA